MPKNTQKNTWGETVELEDQKPNYRITPPGGRYAKNVSVPSNLNSPVYGQQAASEAHNALLSEDA
ncbi:MAG TPA: hypothetical protein VFC30_06615 [Solirubrobacteraceae bacterium]|nr:hypothetical protein [Solirubrobacteraceae bacterium]